MTCGPAAVRNMSSAEAIAVPVLSGAAVPELPQRARHLPLGSVAARRAQPPVGPEVLRLVLDGLHRL